MIPSRRGLEPRRFKNIKHALDHAHENGVDLYEEDEEPNLLYSQKWDKPTRRAVWRTLLGTYGFSPYDRTLLPHELKEGTTGPDFEVT